MWHHTTLHDEEEHCLQRLKVWENIKVCNRSMFARDTTALLCTLISEKNIIWVMHIICQMSLNTCNCKPWSSLFYISSGMTKKVQWKRCQRVWRESSVYEICNNSNACSVKSALYSSHSEADIISWSLEMLFM